MTDLIAQLSYVTASNRFRRTRALLSWLWSEFKKGLQYTPMH